MLVQDGRFSELIGNMIDNCNLCYNFINWLDVGGPCHLFLSTIYNILCANI